MATLQIASVRKSFGDLEILKGVSLEARDGDFLVLVGPSGCGKSTLLGMIAGLETVSDGRIAIDGATVNDIHPKDRDIAMVFQSYALYPNMTVAQNIAFGLEMRKVPKPERDAAVRRVARQLRLEAFLERRPGQLSGGQRQRVAMGRALVRNPKIFLFDEPLSNLDAQLRVEMRTEIKKLHAQLGATIVYVTHDQIEAMTLATKIAVMREGIVQQFGTPAELYADPVNTFVAEFIGSPSMNLVKATLSQRGAERVLDTGKVRLALPSGLLPDDRLGTEVLVGLRPEAITDADGGDRPGSMDARVSAPVVALEPTGPDTMAILDWGSAEVTARLAARTPVRQGEEAPFRVDMGSAVYFDPATGERIGTRLAPADAPVRDAAAWAQPARSSSAAPAAG